ncbi:unnamed protein product, partial [Callosobruchus maculatus]
MVRSTCQLRLIRRPEKNHIYMFVPPSGLTSGRLSVCMVRSTCQLRLFRRPEKNHIYVRPSVRPD